MALNVHAGRTCAARGALVHKVAQLTVADEGAFGVLAVAVETDVRVQVTLVHIWADGFKHEHSPWRGVRCSSGLPLLSPMQVRMSMEAMKPS